MSNPHRTSKIAGNAAGNSVTQVTLTRQEEYKRAVEALIMESPGIMKPLMEALLRDAGTR